MTVARFPQLAHWGAYTALVEDGRVVGCEPFARDPAPSNMLEAIPAMVHSPLRVARPAIRDSWREGKERTGADGFHEVSWDEALAAVAGELARVRETFGNSAIFGGSYGWSSAGHVHHARGLLRRFLFLGGGCVDQVANYSFGAAQYVLPRVIGTFQPIAHGTDWPSIVKHTRLILAFGGLPSKNGQVTFGGGGAHSMDMWLRRAKEAGVEFVSISPLKSDAADFLDAQWLPIRPNTDTALMLAMAHTLLTEWRYDAAFVSRYCTGFERFRRYLLGLGGGDHRRRSRHDPPACAPRGCNAHARELRVVAAARAPRRAALLGGDRAGGDAGRHRASRRRLRLRLRLDQWHRRAARRCSGPRRAAAAQSGADHDPGRAHRRHAAQSRRELRLQRSAVYFPRYSPGLLGRRQSLPSSPGSQSAAARLAEAADDHRARDLVDGDRASRRHRAPRHHAARAQRRRRLLARYVHSRHAPCHRPDRASEERFRHFPQAGAASRLRTRLH